MLKFTGLRSVTEMSAGYLPELQQQLPEHCYLRGYFQSAKYFTEIEDFVRIEVGGLLLNMLNIEGRDFVKRIASHGDCTAVHIRRGDYVSDPAAAKVHGTLGADYYRRAFREISPTAGDRTIWFSDDLEWVAQNLARPGDELCPPGLTTHPGGEIAMMAACRTRVIANSSFSWWAAFLGQQPAEGGVVIAPEEWFTGTHPPAPADLVPASWMRV